MTKEQLQWAMYEAYATQLLNRIEAQEAEIAKLGTMAEQTRADAVTRAAADEKRIAALRHECERWKAAYSDHCALLDVIHASLGINKGDNVIGEIDRIHKARNGLLTQVQDLRAALAKEQELHAATALRLSTEAAKMVERKHPVEVGEWVRRTKLPGDQCPVGIVKQVTEIRCDGDSYGFADGDFWSIDNCTPCDPPQTGRPVPKRAHPVAVGGYLRRLTGFNTTPAGEVARVTLVDDDDPNQLEYEVVRPNGQKGRWSARGCEPCDPPAADHDTPEGKAAAEAAVKVEPKPWDTVRLVRIPSRADVSPELQTNLEWPWLERWGTLNQTALVVEPAYQLAGAVSVCLSANVHARWPICCVEVVRTEPDEIKVGDVVEVFQATHEIWTRADEIGTKGTVKRIDAERLIPVVFLSNNGAYALQDVRKVTT